MCTAQQKKRMFQIALFTFLFMLIPVIGLYAEDREEKLDNWTKIVKKMEVHLNNAYDLYTQGKNKEA